MKHHEISEENMKYRNEANGGVMYRRSLKISDETISRKKTAAAVAK
jgi:hypothetical protein